MHCYMFQTEQQRPSRCDLARGWRTEVAGRTRTVPAPRRPDCYLGVLAATTGIREAPCCNRLTVARETTDYGKIKGIKS
ncbi:hypothetical protein T09_8558 [Trichinella sp. T9]|nr:hypothetical protein T09_8558 [Trichinella sp. T9]